MELAIVPLDRFLNIPSVPFPLVRPEGTKPKLFLAELLSLLNKQQQVM